VTGLAVGSQPGVKAFVGTSGWQYRHWAGRFYPKGLPTSRWLEHYAGFFPTVEVNATFYRLPRRETVERWSAIVPHRFVLTMKASRYVTHIRRLRDCAEPIERMRAVFEGAGGHLGPVLFQLPPTFRADVDLLGSFLEALPAGMRSAFEFRHPSWFTDAVARVLDEHGVALVHGDRPRTRVEVPNVGGWSYLRFHQGRTASSHYPRTKLAEYADALAEAGPKEAFVYFNNDTGGAAPEDASTFMELLAERRVELAA
jgi:uncharacterized protein YecE (DUF72 family)